MRFAPSSAAPSRPALLLVLAACAAADRELSAARDSWRGATYEQVVAAWGPPAKTARDAHTWSSDPVVHRSGGGAGGAVFSAEAPPCERTLIIQDGRVLRAGDWKGTAESCRRFSRR